MAGRAALGLVLGSAPLAAVWFTQPGQAGGGDVKFSAALGALVGTASPWLAVAVVGVGLTAALVAAVAAHSQRVPLGPAMTAAAVLVAAASAGT